MLIIKKTEELTPKELTAIFYQRVNVFVVEQNCPYQEIDTNDFDAIHTFIKNDTNDEIEAYTRTMKKTDYVTFGRVLVNKKYRNQGLGQQIVKETLNFIQNQYSNSKIKIQAQAYLEKFYESFDFKPISDVYLEDNIPHLDMERK